VWKQVVAALLLLTATAGNFSTNAQSVTNAPVKLDGGVYTLRGDMGIFFSRGMDYLAAELNQLGLTASVYNWLDWIALADDAIARYRAAPDRTRILLAGHSRGGDGLIAMAWRLYSAGVPVALAVAFDSTRAVDQVPPNVERFINLYQSTNAVGGGAARPAPGFDGENATVNLADHREMNHVMLALHRAILPQFVEAVSLGSPPGSAGVPMEYRVPAGVVWDSGMAVRAEAGDTASSVAHQFSVPTWVIAQLNQLAPGEAIEPGRTLVMPRMIFAPADVSLATAPVFTRR
jgi:LysM repeat protein